MADEYINAQDLTEDTSLDGEEQFVMFDSTMGKRAKLKNIKTYMNADVAKPDGHYPELTAGNADASAVATALAGGSYTEESVPYKFRHTGGDVTAGGAEEDCIVGGTIAWNQQCRYSRLQNQTIVTNAKESNHYYGNWGQSYIPTTGHVYYLSFYYENPTSNTEYWYWFFGGYGSPITINEPKKVFSKVLKSPGTEHLLRVYGTNSGESAGADIIMQIFDLTQMFGSSVADYIYSLEQSSTGKGVAFFRNMFPEDYYAYNAGELKSVQGLSSHVTTGFNQWDEVWEPGALQTGTGVESESSKYGRTGYIPVMPNTAYYFNSSNKSTWVFGFDANKKFTKMYATNISYNFSFTTDADTRYIRFTMAQVNFMDSNAYLCINLSGDRNGEYEPYKKHSYALDSSLTLRGVPKLVNNKVCFDGDEYRADGSVTRKYGVVDLGTLTWTKMTSGSLVYYNSNDIAGMADWNSVEPATDVICAKYNAIGARIEDLGATERGICHYRRYLAVRDTTYSDAASLASALSGVMVACKLETPITETASAYVNPQACDEYGTEEYISTSIVPVGHKTKYYDNLTKRIDKLPSAIAPLEKSATSSTNYSVGDYLILNNTLYKVTSAISAGGTITAGSNVTATTIMAEIKALR